jgi:hypothetical protein
MSDELDRIYADRIYADRIYVTAAQVRAAQLIVQRDLRLGRDSDSAVVAIATARQLPAAVPRPERRAG